MLDPYASAVLSLLRQDPFLNVIDGSAPDLTRPPYVVVYISADNERSDRLTQQSNVASLRIITHSVGASTTAARRVADKVRAALLDKTLSVSGWSSWPLRHEYGLPPVTDESTGLLVVDAVDGWTVAASRA